MPAGKKVAIRAPDCRGANSFPTPDAIDVVGRVGVDLFECRPGEVAVGGCQKMRDAGAGEFVAHLRPPGGSLVPVLDLANTAVPFEDFDVLVRDRLEVHVEWRTCKEPELLEIDRD